jgi:HEPN domain-containing protein
MNQDAVRIWVLRALHDLKIGKDELGCDDPATDAICFHMQQCVEKYLKAFLVFHKKEIEGTHDIGFLVNRCAEIDADFRSLIELGGPALTTYAVKARYDELVFPSVEEACDAVNLAQHTRDFVCKKLKEKGYALP